MIRKTVSNILNYPIPVGKWDETFENLEKEGRISAKHVHKILVELLKLEEQRENSDF
jgi:hypothetical protein